MTYRPAEARGYSLRGSFPGGPAGRPSHNPMRHTSKRVTVKLPVDTHRALKHMSQETGIPMATLIRLALRTYAGGNLHVAEKPRRTKRGSR